MNRRAFITAITLGTTTVFGGCLSSDAGDAAAPAPLDGEWILRGRVRNEDDAPRAWRVESRSQDRDSLGAAYATVPAGDTWEFELRGQRYNERRAVYVETERGSVTEPWRPAECPRLFAAITITDGRPRLVTECREP